MVNFIVSVIAWFGIGLVVLEILDLERGKINKWAKTAPLWLIFIIIGIWPVVAFFYSTTPKNLDI